MGVCFSGIGEVKEEGGRELPTEFADEGVHVPLPSVLL